jgi:hypothetical protein
MNYIITNDKKYLRWLYLLEKLKNMTDFQLDCTAIVGNDDGFFTIHSFVPAKDVSNVILDEDVLELK